MNTLPKTTLVLALACALPVPGLDAQQLCLAEGAQAGALSLELRSEKALTQQPTVLRQGLEFVAIERTLRTAQQELRTDHPRRLQRQGLWRIELPGLRRLFRYRLSGGKQWGFLLVLGDGSARILLELGGVGTSGLDDPFTDRIGIGPDGHHALVLTKAGALHLCRLDGQDWVSSKAPARVLTTTGVTAPASLAVGTKVAWFVTDRPALWRVSLADQGQPADVSPPAVTGGEFKDEPALSGDGSRLAFLYGPKKLYQIYLLGETGAAVPMTTKAAKYEEPGYLPETVGGPRLMLNDDGTRMYYVDATVRDELYLIDTARPAAALQITADVHFQPYIGTGVLPVFAAARLLIAVGDPKALDWYAADAGSGTVVNLTQTGGNTKAPFGTGLLDLANSTTVGNESWVLESASPGMVLHRVPLGGPSTPARLAVRDQPVWGDALGVEPDLLLPRNGGDLLVDAKGVLLLPLIPGLSFESVVRTAGLRSFELRYLGFAFPCLLADTGSLFVLPPIAEPFRSGLSPSGAWLAQGPELLHLTAKGLQRLPQKTAVRYLLSGAGF